MTIKNSHLLHNYLLLIAFFAVGCVPPNSVTVHKDQPISYVNTFIGTAAYGHTFPGAALPFGMVQLSPTTGASRQKAGYSYFSVPHGRDSDTIGGFTHTNLSGTGLNTLAKYSNIAFMPTVGDLMINPGTNDEPDTGYRSRFSHDREGANPGYYHVVLDDYNIFVELTATERVGMHRYTFPKSEKSNVIIDITRDIVDPERNIGAYINIIGDNRIEGYTTVMGSASNEPMTWFFYCEFSKPFNSYGTFREGEILHEKRTAEGPQGIGAYISYSTHEGESVIAKVGISFTGIEGARRNLEKEIVSWDFDEVRSSAEDVWNKQLSKVQIDGGSDANKTKFYTSMYHSFLFPRVFSDSDGAYYSHFKDQILTDAPFRYYVDFSLWDTYRTVHPLFTILEPERQIEMIRTLLTMFEQGGRLPGQVSYRNFYSQIMIGDHGSTVIFDSYLKGLREFDVEQAYEAMRKNIFEPEKENISHNLGYVPADVTRESVSKTLEDSYVYWGTAQMAKELGRHEDYLKLMQYARNYENLYHHSTGFYLPRFSDGRWLHTCRDTGYIQLSYSDNNTLFDCWNENTIFYSPYRHYTESNAWQYLFNPQHDIQGLIILMGGREKFIQRLDALFSVSSSNQGAWYVGVTGAVGQYVHGNEPSLHKAFLYNFAGKPWKTQQRIHNIRETLYTTDEWGIPGNDDMGTLSAWYVFAALGFYPVTPGQPYYVITSPQFERAEINLNEYYDNVKFTILANNVSGDNKFIQSAKLNGQPFNRTWISHEEIVSGGTLEFEMGSEPDRNWGTGIDASPPSMTRID